MISLRYWLHCVSVCVRILSIKSPWIKVCSSWYLWPYLISKTTPIQLIVTRCLACDFAPFDRRRERRYKSSSMYQVLEAALNSMPQRSMSVTSLHKVKRHHRHSLQTLWKWKEKNYDKWISRHDFIIFSLFSGKPPNKCRLSDICPANLRFWLAKACSVSMSDWHTDLTLLFIWCET